MSTAKELHDQAMDLVETAILERIKGDAELTVTLYAEALELELAAIAILDEHGQTAEPTWSVLHRGAGWMAFNSNQFRRAEQLACKALAGDPHPEIADELREVWEQANSYRHLELKGVVLAPDEMQVSLAGAEVGWGFMGFPDFKIRVENTLKLLVRIVERQAGRPYRERGRVPADLSELYQPYISAPRAGSFAVTVKLSSPIEQMAFPETTGAPEIVDEFMDLVELVNKSSLEAIQQRIPDPAYQRNFIGLAKNIAPDGDRIRQVGFTVVRPGQQRSVEFTRPAADIKPTTIIPDRDRDPHTPQPLVGMLLGADATRADDDRIKIVDDDRKKHELRVREGLGDIVPPMWDTKVSVTWSREGGNVFVEDIDRAEPV